MTINKETLRRAGRTFIQTAAGYIVVNLAMVDFSSGKQAVKSAATGLAVSAMAAGIAAAMNLNKQEG